MAPKASSAFHAVLEHQVFAEADSQNAFAGGIFPNQGKQQSSFGGNTGSGGEHNLVKIGDLFQCDLVVAGNRDLIDTCFAQQLYDVVCKGVVIVKNQQFHGGVYLSD